MVQLVGDDHPGLAEDVAHLRLEDALVGVTLLCTRPSCTKPAMSAARVTPDKSPPSGA